MRTQLTRFFVLDTKEQVYISDCLLVHLCRTLLLTEALHELIIEHSLGLELTFNHA